MSDSGLLPPPTLPYQLAMPCEGVGVYLDRIAPAYFPEHAHPEIEIAILFEGAAGSARWQSPTGRLLDHQMRAGEVSIVPSGQPHAGSWERAAENLIIYLDPGFLSRAARESVPGELVELPGTWAVDDTFLLQLGSAVRAELRCGGAATRLYVESVATFLAGHLLRRYAITDAPLRPVRGGLSADVLRRAIDYIHDHLADDLTLSGIARIASISPYHFARLFQRATGQTPHRYVMRRRIEQAQRLLLAGDRTVTEIAAQVGFCDQSHFTHCFKRHTGVTPGRLLRLRAGDRSAPQQ